MSRSEADRHQRCAAGAVARRFSGALVCAAVLWAIPPGASAQISSGGGLGLDLTPTTRQSLDRLEDGWTQWAAALYKDDGTQLAEIEDRLLGTARELGLSRLPDLAAGALLKAEEAAREKDAKRAERALAAAERLDPGRPEAAFGAARVNRQLGRWYKVPFDEFRGYLRVPGQGLEWRLARANLVLFLLAAVALSAVLFLALQIFTHGTELLSDLTHLLSRALKRPLDGAGGMVLVLAVLVWPLALPGGLLWLAGYWSVLVWGLGSRSERWLTIGLWLLLGAAPLAVDRLRQPLGLELSPPLRAAEDVIAGRLPGGLFADLGALPGLLPDHSAVNQFLADVYRRIGQWDHARGRYRELLASEPGNVAALVDLGAHSFNKEDFGAAQDYFKRAIAADPNSAVAHYDLGKALHAALHYDEGGEAIRRAQALDAQAVTQWNASGEPLIVVDGGLARLGEIHRALGDDSTRTGTSSPGLLWFRRYLSVFLGLGAMSLAVGFDLARRRFRPYQRRPASELKSHRHEGRWRGLVPGLESVRAGHGVRAFVAVLLPVALVLLPATEHFAYRIPWRMAPPGLLAWGIAVLGLAALAWYRAAAAYGDR